MAACSGKRGALGAKEDGKNVKMVLPSKDAVVEAQYVSPPALADRKKPERKLTIITASEFVLKQTV